MIIVSQLVVGTGIKVSFGTRLKVTFDNEGSEIIEKKTKVVLLDKEMDKSFQTHMKTTLITIQLVLILDN